MAAAKCASFCVNKRHERPAPGRLFLPVSSSFIYPVWEAFFLKIRVCIKMRAFFFFLSFLALFSFSGRMDAHNWLELASYLGEILHPSIHHHSSKKRRQPTRLF